MNMINDQETGREKDRERSGVRCSFRSWRRRLDEARKSALPFLNILADLQIKRKDQNQLGEYHTRSLEVYCLPTIISQIEHLQHFRICQLCALG